MSLESRTQAYLRKAIRLARIEATGPHTFTASLPEFGLMATGESRDDAEHALLTRLLTITVGAQHLGYRLPIIDGIDLNEATGDSVVHPDEPDDQQWFQSPDWLAGERQATAEIEAGQYDVFSSDDEFLSALPN